MCESNSRSRGGISKPHTRCHPGEGGRASGRVGFFKRQPDRFQNPVELAIDFEVGEPEDFVSEVGQDFVSNLIAPAMFVESMLIAVDLDNEARLAALESTM